MCWGRFHDNRAFINNVNVFESKSVVKSKSTGSVGPAKKTYEKQKNYIMTLFLLFKNKSQITN